MEQKVPTTFMKKHDHHILWSEKRKKSNSFQNKSEENILKVALFSSRLQNK